MWLRTSFEANTNSNWTPKSGKKIGENIMKVTVKLCGNFHGFTMVIQMHARVQVETATALQQQKHTLLFIYIHLYICICWFVYVCVCGLQVIRLFLASFESSWNYYTFTLGLFIHMSNHQLANDLARAALWSCWFRFVIAVAPMVLNSIVCN